MIKMTKLRWLIKLGLWEQLWFEFEELDEIIFKQLK